MLLYTIAMVGEYVTSCCLYSVHKLCQITWHSGLLAQLEEHIIVGICDLSQMCRMIAKMEEFINIVSNLRRIPFKLRFTRV